MEKFVCPVCGYVYEGDEIPEGFKCPVCHVDGSKFKEMDTTKLAAEHEFGIYEKTVRDNPDISEEDKKTCREVLFPFWEGKSVDEYCETQYRECGGLELSGESYVSDCS